MSARMSVLVAIPAALSIAGGLIAQDAAPQARESDALLVLWLAHACGKPEAVEPARDVALKIDIAATLLQGPSLTESAVLGFRTSETFSRLAGDDGRLDLPEVRRQLATATPPVRGRLFPRVEAHVRFLTTGFDRIGEPYRER